MDRDKLMLSKNAAIGLSAWIDDERLRRVFLRVVRRLPKLDRAIFLNKCMHVEIGSKAEGALGSVIGGTEIGGYETSDMHLEEHLCDRYPIPAVAAVVAHEIAHIVLRHDKVSYAKAPEREREWVKDVHEWDANLLVWKWGFKAELRALWKALQDPLIPAWCTKETDPPPKREVA